MSMRQSLAISEMGAQPYIDGDTFADGFKSLGMVDTASATSLDTSKVGVLKPTTTGDTYTTSADPTLSAAASAGSQNNSTSRIRIPASALAASGDKVRITLKASTLGQMQWSAVYIGHADTDGSFDGTQVPATAGGLAGHTLAAGASIELDPVDYALDETRDLIISIAHGPNSAAQYNFSQAGYTWYNKDYAADASATTAVGYSAMSNAVLSVDRVTVRTEAGTAAAMTVASEIIPCAFEPSAISGVVRVVPESAVELNTDLMVDVRRDPAGDWVEAALELFFQHGGTSVLTFGPVSMSGEVAGQEPQYRIRTSPGTMAEVDGVALSFAP